MKAYEHFWASLSWIEWLLIVSLLAALILVALAAAAFGNPTRTSLPRRPTPLPDKRPYLGAHREVDPQERTTNLGKYRRRKPD